MNLSKVVSPMRRLAFRTWRSLTVIIPGGRIRAFGGGTGQIGAILVVNLDRQPRRWRRVARELGRFRTSEGAPLTSITRRLAAVDARDGRAVAATVDVDAMYRIGDQLHVQPDAQLAECFAEDEPVRMTRQEVAIARSHVEAWKAVASGTDDYVLVLEDDVWFTPGAPAAIDRGWRGALRRCAFEGGPRLLYLSYDDAGGTAVRDDPCDVLFRPVRGLWFLSGYVLSREGAVALLQAMPVVGPVDLWMNYRFAELGALALSSPAIAQRQDGASDNAYSVLPYLARAGIVDAGYAAMTPNLPRVGPVLAWTARAERESLAMALSMLGLRVRAFDGDEEPMPERELKDVLKTFDALVDPPLMPATITAAAADGALGDPPGGRRANTRRVGARAPAAVAVGHPAARRVLGRIVGSAVRPFGPCQARRSFPGRSSASFRLFRDDRLTGRLGSSAKIRQDNCSLDDSPWVLPSSSDWRPGPPEPFRARGWPAYRRSPMTRRRHRSVGSSKRFQATWHRSRGKVFSTATRARN